MHFTIIATRNASDPPNARRSAGKSDLASAGREPVGGTTSKGDRRFRDDVSETTRREEWSRNVRRRKSQDARDRRTRNRPEKRIFQLGTSKRIRQRVVLYGFRVNGSSFSVRFPSPARPAGPSRPKNRDTHVMICARLGKTPFIREQTIENKEMRDTCEEATRQVIVCVYIITQRIYGVSRVLFVLPIRSRVMYI